MSKFIELTEKIGTTAYKPSLLNIEAIIRISDRSEGAFISTTDGNYTVKESYEEVKKLIAKPTKKLKN